MERDLPSEAEAQRSYIELMTLQRKELAAKEQEKTAQAKAVAMVDGAAGWLECKSCLTGANVSPQPGYERHILNYRQGRKIPMGTRCRREQSRRALFS
jgi:hypothetical protein